MLAASALAIALLLAAMVSRLQDRVTDLEDQVFGESPEEREP